MLEGHLAAARARVADGHVLLAPLQPDLAFVHAVCADAAGNLVLTPPWGDGIAGLMAAQKGVIATVERIVSTDEIRKLQGVVRLPRHAVLAVCEAPFGAHPAGLWAPGIDCYAEDYPFLAEVRRAARGDLDAWFDERIAPGREVYLSRIDQIDLRRRARDPVPTPAAIDGPATAEERAIVECARILAEKCRADGHHTLLAGIGTANLAAWLAVRQFAAVDLMAELGLYGYWPQPGEPFVFHFANLPTCLSLGDIGETMGMHLRRGMAVLGAAQIDAAGNVNTTQVGDKYLLGSGGHNDCASLAREVVVLCGADRLVDKVDYVTSPGARISTLVTERGVYAKVDGRLQLRSPAADWREPEPELLRLLRAWDPNGYFRASAS
jgi:hypothetical protein